MKSELGQLLIKKQRQTEDPYKRSIIRSNTNIASKINLEQVVKLCSIYLEIMELLKQKKYFELFNKCSHWWDNSLNDSFAFLNLNKNFKIEQERGRKLELLGILSVQYLSYCYDLEIRFSKLTKKFIIPDNNPGIALGLDILNSAYQSFLSIANQALNYFNNFPTIKNNVHYNLIVEMD